MYYFCCFILFVSVCIFWKDTKKMTKLYTYEVDKDLEGAEEEKNHTHNIAFENFQLNKNKINVKIQT